MNAISKFGNVFHTFICIFACICLNFKRIAFFIQFSLANSTMNYFLESNAWPRGINFRKNNGKTETIFECLTFCKFFARWSGFDEYLMQIFAVVESTEGNKLVIKWIHSLNVTQFYSQIRSILIGCKICSSMIKSASHYYSFLLLLFMLKDFTSF